MKPLTLRLKGFRGIRDGLGRDEITLDLESLARGCALVALVGMNGRGKTTLMDNLHPYPVMPSRAGADGLGSFSYYDHLSLPESEKDLIWEHDGRRLHTHQVFWSNGRRRTDAYLFERCGEQWRPVRLPDGTLSDGKTETYLRCVEGILGSAETFFTSVFSAQGKRQLSAYRNGEIKTLLADLLGLDHIRCLGRNAAETGRLLKAALGAVRHEQAGIDEQFGRVRGQQQRLAGARERARSATQARGAAAAQVGAKRDALATLVAERTQTSDIEQRRNALQAERQKVDSAARATLVALDMRERAEVGRGRALQQRIEARVAVTGERRNTLAQRLTTARRALESVGAVRRACRRLELARTIERERALRLAPAEATVLRAQELGHEAAALDERLAAIEREAGQASLHAADLRRRFALTEQVPCAGMDLQGRCQLLGEAREAQALIPNADSTLARLADDRAAIVAALEQRRAEQSRLTGAADRLSAVRRHLEVARTRASRLAELAARKDQIEFAEATVRATEQELAALPENVSTLNDDERREREALDAALAAIAGERAASESTRSEAIQRIDAALESLPAPFDEARLRHAERAVADAQARATIEDQAHLAAVRDAQALESLDSQGRELAAKQAVVSARAHRVADELGHWNLLAKCLSNDGVIALAIDDAGPALAAFANDLLLACYGPRFTVSIRTLVETAKGEPREGFEILVHDADSGESKSVSLMSGGERVWINECLTRAIALYLAQNSGRRYGVLFCDEADGPLDPEHKRMFMAMKREVLRLGGYEQEFFVSQSPELAAMADVIIDLDQIHADPVEAEGHVARLDLKPSGR